jgi:hypothetical protein
VKLTRPPIATPVLPSWTSNPGDGGGKGQLSAEEDDEQ